MQWPIILIIGVLLAACAPVPKSSAPAPNPGTDSPMAFIRSKTHNLNFYGKIDFIRDFINKNSRQGSYTYNVDTDMDKVLNDLYTSYKTNNPTLTHVRCGLRTLLMIKILNDLGYEGRQVGIWTDTGSNGDWNHAFLEVRNPAMGLWEVSDPTYDVHYVDLQGNRLGIESLITLPISAFKPCNHTACGWDLPASPGAPGFPPQHLIDVGMLDLYTSVGTKELVINTDRFNDMVFSFLGTTVTDYYSGLGSIYQYNVRYVQGGY